MEELDLRELLKYYLERIPIIILITLITFLGGFIDVEYIQVPMYKTSATIVLLEDNINEDLIVEDSNFASDSLINSYIEITKSKSVLEKVAEELEISYSTNVLSSFIQISQVTGTPFIKINVTDYSNENAVLIANKVIELSKSEIKKIYRSANVYTLDEAEVNPNSRPYNINKGKTIVIATGVGLGISFVLIFIMFYFDETIKNRKDIESSTGLIVLGEVPVLRHSKVKKDNYKLKNIITDSKISNSKFENIDIDKVAEPKKQKKYYNRNKKYEKSKGGAKNEKISKKN